MDQVKLGRFGDARLASVSGDLLAAMQTKRTMCVQARAKDRPPARQFNRFLDNDAVSSHEMLVHAGGLTGARVAGRHVLAISDTSEMNFACHSVRKRGFGTVGNGTDIGVLLHPVIAVDAVQGGLIGLVGAAVMNRTGGKVTDRKQRLADAKESRRWLSGTETASTVLAGAAAITMVEDREGDIYDQFARRPENVHLLVRAARDRPAIPDLFRIPEALLRMRALVAEMTKPRELADFLPAVPPERRGQAAIVRSAVASTFVAALELCRSAIGLDQARDFGDYNCLPREAIAAEAGVDGRA